MGYREEVQAREMEERLAMEERLLGSGVGEQRTVNTTGQKRLVPKHRYLLTMLGKGGLYSSALLFFGGGVVLLLLDALFFLSLPIWAIWAT